MSQILLKYLTVLFALFSLGAQSQTFLIQGVVLDSTNNTGIPYAHIYIHGTSLGTVSNLEGKYALHIPDSYRDSILVVSSIGYNSEYFDLEPLDTRTHEINFHLSYSRQFLENVTIVPQDAREIWLAAIKGYRKMFTTSPHTLKAYYRTTFQEDGYFSRLLEAAVNLHGGGRATSKATIEYVQLRKSADLRRNTWEIYDGYLNHLVYNHPIRSSFDFLSKGGLRKYEIEITKKQYQDDDLFYTLLAQSTPKGRYDAEMLVREKDYAIHRIVIKWKPENSNDFSWAWERKDSAHFHCDWQTSTYEYQEFQGKMYQKLARWHRSGKVVDDNTNEIRFRTESIDELLITDIRPGKTTKPNKVPTEVVNIYEMADYFEYNPAFWASYNRPVDTEYFTSARRKIEEYAPLEEQFREFSGQKVADEGY